MDPYRAEAMKPRIGITTTPRLHEDRFLEALDRTFVTAVIRSGAVPFILPVLEPEDARAALTCLDGVLFTGGGDVDPARYGAEPSPEVDGVDPTRDAFELALVEAAVELDLPILGVCRGAQVMNVARGGSLIQHLPDVTDQSHRERERWAETVHPVRIEQDSRLLQVLQQDLIGVNTLHHQAVDRLGSGLRAVGWAGDGTVEAIEGVDGLRILGVQWHPELLLNEPGHPALFSWLAAEATRPRAMPSRTAVAHAPAAELAVA
jgi:putative glutamine amidotransferase